MVEFVLCMVSPKLDLGRAPSSADYLTEELVIINSNVGTLSWDTQTDRNPGELFGSRNSQWKRCLVHKYLCDWFLENWRITDQIKAFDHSKMSRDSLE